MERYLREAQTIDLDDTVYVSEYYLNEIFQSYTLESEIFLCAIYASIRRKERKVIKKCIIIAESPQTAQLLLPCWIRGFRQSHWIIL